VVEALLPNIGRLVDGGLTILDEYTIEKPYGWVFFYDSSRFLETRRLEDGIAGYGPLLVLADTGEVVHLETARDVEDSLADLEQARGLRAR
jgi:hypothetical protein